MGTEERTKKFIDEMTPYRALSHLLKELEAPRAVKMAFSSIHVAIPAIAKRLSQNDRGRLIYIGAGTSGRLGNLDASELYPTFGWPKNRIVQLVAGGDRALKESVEGAEDQTVNVEVVIDMLKLNENDVLIAVAASGTTPYVLAAMRQAKKYGALTIGIANNADRPILTQADHPIFLDTGPEPIAGSTRMKAGTAQHVTLKTISTLVMVRLGYVYKGMMVNVRASNDKLKKRAVSVVRLITGSDDEDATKKTLELCDWEIGVAVLVLRGVPIPCATTLYLKLAQRDLHAALVLEELEKMTR